jgi:hypothetical protein
MDQTLPTSTLLLHLRGLAAFAGSGGLLGLGHHISASSGGSSGSTNIDEIKEKSGAGVAASAIARMFACVDRVKHQSSSIGAAAADGEGSSGGGAVRVSLGFLSC